MTEQNFATDAARVAISTADRYPRAGARGDRDPAPADPARAKMLTGTNAATPPTVAPEPTGPAPAPPTGQPRRPSGRFARYPLRRYAARIRKLGHAGHAGAATPRDELAEAVDYVRRAEARAEQAGMRDPVADAAIRAANRALMAAGDALTDAMHTWSPAP